MSTIEERVKKIVVEQLGVKEEEAPTMLRSLMISALIRSTPLSW